MMLCSNLLDLLVYNNDYINNCDNWKGNKGLAKDFLELRLSNRNTLCGNNLLNCRVM